MEEHSTTTGRSGQQWVVGVDGSSSSEHALRWAIARGAERYADLAAIRSWDPSVVGMPSLVALDITPDPPPNLVEEMSQLISRIDTTGVPVTCSLEHGPAAGVLLDASERADLLIVGTRGLGGFKRLVLGSVSHQCATHSTVPVVVIPANAELGTPHGRIVVGMDGSDNSKAALRWAIGYALPGTSVVAIGVQQPVPLAAATDPGAVHTLAGDSREAFEAAVEEVLHPLETEATVTSQFWHASPVETLLREAAAADLLVVGARGHGRLSSALLGSTSNRILHQTNGPVAVVSDRPD